LSVFDRYTFPPAAVERRVSNADPMAELPEMLEPAMFVGLGAVAVWAYVCYPGLRPGSLTRAALHVAVSFIGFALLPTTLSFLLPFVHAHSLRLGIALALLISTLTYVLLSWIWLIARILHELLGGPRGGHPVPPGHQQV
jgi:hypothetical protein